MAWYEWAFDGVGGAAGVALCAWLLRRWAKLNKPGAIQSSQVANISAPVGTSQIAVGTKIKQTFENHHHHHQPDDGVALLRNSEPTPLQILEDLGGAVPFDRAHAMKKYVGLPVFWKLRFHAVSEMENHSWLVHTYFVPDSKDEFDCHNVRFVMSEIPALLLAAPWSSVLWVRGTIASVDFGFDLDKNPEIVRIERPILTPPQPPVAPSESIGEKNPPPFSRAAPTFSSQRDESKIARDEIPGKARTTPPAVP